jgi:hypothetical protein
MMTMPTGCLIECLGDRGLDINGFDGLEAGGWQGGSDPEWKDFTKIAGFGGRGVEGFY